MDDAGKIAVWRDYYDSLEIATQTRNEVSSS
jgi:hypothetical protein